MSGTATKSSSSTVFIVGLIAAVAAGVYAMGSSGKTDFEDDRTERVTVGIAFDPNQRPKAPVNVIVSVDNTQVKNVSLKSSPWSDTITVPKGAQVSVHAVQETGGKLSCTLLVNNKQVDTNSRADQGSIRCWHNRRK